ncbi:hypothetical protein KC19_VG012700 [Ceratodon purpureus]|uniref:Uncharacterized protein n=1 Tax=Ceratodon purpureus TaxID=3225 RepID=A0A8T0HKW3_CERPU|nr:hypothetical protein KC19_VG012700 [Ceratodon purpureus]
MPSVSSDDLLARSYDHSPFKPPRTCSNAIEDGNVVLSTLATPALLDVAVIVLESACTEEEPSMSMLDIALPDHVAGENIRFSDMASCALPIKVSSCEVRLSTHLLFAVDISSLHTCDYSVGENMHTLSSDFAGSGVFGKAAMKPSMPRIRSLFPCTINFTPLQW